MGSVCKSTFCSFVSPVFRAVQQRPVLTATIAAAALGCFAFFYYQSRPSSPSNQAPNASGPSSGAVESSSSKQIVPYKKANNNQGSSVDTPNSRSKELVSAKNNSQLLPSSLGFSEKNGNGSETQGDLASRRKGEVRNVAKTADSSCLASNENLFIFCEGLDHLSSETQVGETKASSISKNTETLHLQFNKERDDAPQIFKNTVEQLKALPKLYKIDFIYPKEKLPNNTPIIDSLNNFGLGPNDGSLLSQCSALKTVTLSIGSIKWSGSIDDTRAQQWNKTALI